MAEIQGLQQVHSMSSAVEKVQQVQQQQGELHLKQVADQLTKKHEMAKTEVVPFDEIANALIREDKEGNRGETGTTLLPKKKTIKKTEEDTAEIIEEEIKSGDEEHLIDIII